MPQYFKQFANIKKSDANTFLKKGATKRKPVVVTDYKCIVVHVFYRTKDKNAAHDYS